MPYEVELKFPLVDPAEFESRLAKLGAGISTAEVEVDEYFAHPARDFALSDEALRIRRKDSQNSLTYKGPKIDPNTKTRSEIDLPLPPGEQSAQAWTELFKALGFKAAGLVRKSQRKTHIAWQGRTVEISLDCVEGIGEFVELELIVEPNELESARQCVASLAKELNLAGGERRSYLELALASNYGGVQK